MSNIEYYDIQYAAERTKRHVGIESHHTGTLSSLVSHHQRSVTYRKNRYYSLNFYVNMPKLPILINKSQIDNDYFCIKIYSFYIRPQIE